MHGLMGRSFLSKSFLGSRKGLMNKIKSVKSRRSTSLDSTDAPAAAAKVAEAEERV